MLPLSQVGGYVLGARALAVAGASSSDAAASTIVDVNLEFFAQLAYIAIALLWLLRLDPHAQATRPVAIGLAVASCLACGFLIAQRRGFKFLERFADALGRGRAQQAAAGASTLHTAIGRIYARSPGIWASFALHLVCWIAAAAEIWLALKLIGRPRGFGVVLVIESLLYAVRSIAFAVPNAFGVQEGAYIVLGAGFGLAPDVALGLSLLKRARDFAIGVPALVIYQLIESGRLWRVAGGSSTRPLVSETPAITAGAPAYPPRRKRRDPSASSGGPSGRQHDAPR